MKLCDDGVYNLAAAVLAQARRDYIYGIKGGGAFAFNTHENQEMDI